MQTYDVLMLLVLAAATMFGFWKGMAWQIASLASFVVSYVAALRFSTQLAPIFGDHAPLNRFVAMLAIYIGVSFVIWMMFRLVSGIIDKVRLESFDRQLGAMFGLAKGVLLCVAITFFAVTLLPQPQGEAIVSSQSGRYIVALLDKSHSVFPPEIHQVLDPYLHKIEEKLNPGFQPHRQAQPAGWPPIPTPLPAQAGIAWPQIAWPSTEPTPQQSSPTTAPPPSFGWPSETPPPTAPAGSDPYTVPREPNPFPGPYSAEAPGGRDY
jgi:membrane protein required for colicin V production